MENSYYKINTPRVVHQILDGEAIIIDFETGAYYSLDEIGSQVWFLIDRGFCLSELAAELSHYYEQSEAEINEAIMHFIEQLLLENLICPAEIVPNKKSVNGTPFPTEVKVFQAPALQKFTDMQDLLLLDPIHEVDQSGWPTQKPLENE
jgi:hypothetical protein